MSDVWSSWEVVIFKDARREKHQVEVETDKKWVRCKHCNEIKWITKSSTTNLKAHHDKHMAEKKLNKKQLKIDRYKKKEEEQKQEPPEPMEVQIDRSDRIYMRNAIARGVIIDQRPFSLINGMFIYIFYIYCRYCQYRQY